jgi:uncharacterized coiled-coil DUF342 family protein
MLTVERGLLYSCLQLRRAASVRTRPCASPRRCGVALDLEFALRPLTAFASARSTVNKNKARAEEIKGILEGRRNGKDGSGASNPVRAKLNECREKFKELVKQKQILRGQFDAAMKNRDAARDAAKELKSLIKFKDVNDIEAEVERLESEIAHSSLSLNEEKKVMESIRQLKNSKTVVTEYSAKMESLAADESTCKEINAAMKSLDTEINAIRKEEDEFRAQMNEERKKEEASGTDNKSLWDEKEKCREACKEAYEKIKDLRAKHDARWQEYKAQEKVWRAQQAADKAKKREEYLQEKAARDAERAQREKEMAPEPFSEEIVKCEQLAAYLNKFIGEGEGKSGAEQATDAPQALEGMTAFVKKEDPDFAWMKGAGNGGGKKKGKKSKASDKPVDSSKEKLVHTVDILGAFASLKLSVPMIKGDCAGVLKQVDEKKEEYAKKQLLAKEAGEAAVHENAAFEAGASTDAGSSKALNGNGGNESNSHEKEDNKGKSKGKNKGSKPVALRLDDESSWPSMGGPGVPAPAAPTLNGVYKLTTLAASAENTELEEGEVLPTPKNGSTIAVSIDVNTSNGKCSVHFS